MSSYVFPGFPPFLATAALELGLPDSADSARRISSLTGLANLCAQASRADLEHVEGILAKAAEFRDEIAIALRAAELMLADVEAGRRRPSSRDAGPSADPASPSSRTGRKGPRAV